jgi:DNA processing protein
MELRAVRTVGQSSPEYPRLLQECPDAPDRVFVAGRLLEPAPYLAVVGARRPTRYGLEVTGWLAREISAAGLVVVSGMAAGIDSAAHRGALKAGAPTVAVLGCGLDICYPRRNRDLYETLSESGTLVSEYEAGVQPLPHHFPQRNRIIAGMSLGVVVVEGRPEGGAMITARLAGEYGREVFAVPGPCHSANSEGPHRLIREGARLVSSPDELLEDLGLDSLIPVHAETERPGLGPDERRVLAALEATPELLDRVARVTGMPPSSAAAVLSRLEIAGLVARHAGGRFSLVVSVR